MGSGLMQLLATGQQDIYLTGNPAMTHFKKVFRTHTNFAMEPIEVPFVNRSDCFIYEKTSFKAKIERHADLIAQVYFVFEIPDIVSDNVMSFRWIEHLGEAIIDNCSISIGGNIIDKQYGEYLYIQNSLTMDQAKRDIYNKMTGNVMQVNDPDTYNQITSQTFNSLSRIPLRYRIGSGYPTASKDPNNFVPSIPTRKIYVPLQFWFTRDYGCALPLVSLQYSEVEINIEIRPFVELYKIVSNRAGDQNFYAPNLSISGHTLDNFVSNVRQRFLISSAVLDIRAHLEINYIYLDTLERQYFAYKPLQYMIEQTTRIEYRNLLNNNVVDLILQNPIRDCYFVCKRNDLRTTNNWFVYTDKGSPILQKAKIMFNGLDRIPLKEAEFFSYVQPFQHYKGNNVDGLYVYSFSLYPTEYQPSGSFNASRVNKIQFYMNVATPKDDTYGYDAVFYVNNYNLLLVSSGLCGVKYSL